MINIRFFLLVLAASVLIAAGPDFRANAEEAPAKQTAPATDQQPSKKQDKKAVPFRGSIKAVSASAGTLEVGDRTFHVNASTKIEKDGKPAKLQDCAAGDYVTGSYRKSGDKLIASSVYLGGKKGKKSKTSKPTA
jgi:hypothetical protein